MNIKKELETTQCFDVINYLNKVHGVPDDSRLDEISKIQTGINSQLNILDGINPTRQEFEGIIPFAGSLFCNSAFAGIGLGMIATLSIPTIYSYMMYKDVKNSMKDVNNLANSIAKTMYYDYEEQCKNNGKISLTYEQVCDDAYAYEMMLQKLFEEKNCQNVQSEQNEQEM